MDYKIFTSAELYEHLIDYDLDNPCQHIIENIENLKYFNGLDESYGEKMYYFCFYEDKKIIAVLKFKTGGNESWRYPGWKNWMSSISVRKEYQGLGLSRKIIEEFYKFCKEKNFDVLMSGYSIMGWNRIKHIFRELAVKYDIKLLDDKTEPEFGFEDNIKPRKFKIFENIGK